jgi:tRNA-2-methylthio-N6-dimethylallyladenosine synthase
MLSTHGKYYLETYGCQMNEYDSELVRSILNKNGFLETANEIESDIVFLNTCSVRENAHNKVYGRLQKLGELRKKRTHLLVGVLGCMAQSLKMDLLENSIYVDIVAGPDSYRKLPKLIETAINGNDQAADFDLSEFETYDDIYPVRKEGVNAWIAVMRGCDNFCTFCVVPYARGRERSRSVENVTAEAGALAADGYSQVTLLGQNVNSYEHNNHSFADLIRAVADIDGIKRVRFTSPHPKDFPEDLLDEIAGNQKVCNHIHLPLQAGSDRILKMMRRNYTSDDFIALTDKIRNKIPDLVLTTDIILGFPTETRDEYEQTVKLVETVRFDSAFIFNYSERPGTVAKRRWSDDVTADEKKYRITRLNDIQKKISIKQNHRHIGEVMEILVEGPSKRDPQQWVGRTNGNKMTVFQRDDQQPGDYVRVEIIEATANTLKSELIK